MVFVSEWLECARYTHCQSVHCASYAYMYMYIYKQSTIRSNMLGKGLWITMLGWLPGRVWSAWWFFLASLQESQLPQMISCAMPDILINQFCPRINLMGTLIRKVLPDTTRLIRCPPLSCDLLNSIVKQVCSHRKKTVGYRQLKHCGMYICMYFLM